MTFWSPKKTHIANVVQYKCVLKIMCLTHREAPKLDTSKFYEISGKVIASSSYHTYSGLSNMTIATIAIGHTNIDAIALVCVMW